MYLIILESLLNSGGTYKKKEIETYSMKLKTIVFSPSNETDFFEGTQNFVFSSRFI